MYNQGHMCVFIHTDTFIFLPHIPSAFTSGCFFTLHATWVFNFRNIQLFFIPLCNSLILHIMVGHPSFIKSDESLGDAWENHNFKKDIFNSLDQLHCSEELFDAVLKAPLYLSITPKVHFSYIMCSVVERYVFLIGRSLFLWLNHIFCSLSYYKCLCL